MSYVQEAYTNLRKILNSRWDFVVMQAEEQLKVAKDRKKEEKQIIDSQEKAYWRVYRPPPGYTTVVENSPVPTREQRVKARSKTKEHIQEEVRYRWFSIRNGAPISHIFMVFQVKFLRDYTSKSRSKVSVVADSLIEFIDMFTEFDPVLIPVCPSNPWITDDQTFWLHNQPL